MKKFLNIFILLFIIIDLLLLIYYYLLLFIMMYLLSYNFVFAYYSVINRGAIFIEINSWNNSLQA